MLVVVGVGETVIGCGGGTAHVNVTVGQGGLIGIGIAVIEDVGREVTGV